MEGGRGGVKEGRSHEGRKSGREERNCIWVESRRVGCISWGWLWEDEHWSLSNIIKSMECVCVCDQRIPTRF